MSSIDSPNTSEKLKKNLVEEAFRLFGPGREWKSIIRSEGEREIERWMSRGDKFALFVGDELYTFIPHSSNKGSTPLTGSRAVRMSRISLP